MRSENVRPRGEEAAERDVDARRDSSTSRRRARGRAGSLTNRGPTNAARGATPAAGELHRVIEEREQRGRGARAPSPPAARHGDSARRSVSLNRPREARAAPSAQRAQLGQLLLLRESRRSLGGIAERLPARRHRARVGPAGTHVGAARARATRASRRTRADPRRRASGSTSATISAEALRHRCRLPQQVWRPRLAPGGRASRPSPRVAARNARRCPRRPAPTGETWVAPRAQAQLAWSKPSPRHPPRRPPSGRDHHLVTAPRQRRPDRRQRQVVRDVVGTDEQRCHAARPARSGWSPARRARQLAGHRVDREPAADERGRSRARAPRPSRRPAASFKPRRRSSRDDVSTSTPVAPSSTYVAGAAILGATTGSPTASASSRREPELLLRARAGVHTGGATVPGTPERAAWQELRHRVVGPVPEQQQAASQPREAPLDVAQHVQHALLLFCRMLEVAAHDDEVEGARRAPGRPPTPRRAGEALDPVEASDRDHAAEGRRARAATRPPLPEVAGVRSVRLLRCRPPGRACAARRLPRRCGCHARRGGFGRCRAAPGGPPHPPAAERRRARPPARASSRRGVPGREGGHADQLRRRSPGSTLPRSRHRG